MSCILFEPRTTSPGDGGRKNKSPLCPPVHLQRLSGRLAAEWNVNCLYRWLCEGSSDGLPAAGSSNSCSVQPAVAVTSVKLPEEGPTSHLLVTLRPFPSMLNSSPVSITRNRRLAKSSKTLCGGQQHAGRRYLENQRHKQGRYLL